MRLIQSGPRNAKIVIVGEAPGTKEAQVGQPFIGGSGELLNKCLNNAGLDRSQIFLTNLCHVQPPGNKFDWFHKKANRPHYEFGVTKLLLDLMAIKPNLVIALGSEPLYALTERKGITKWRGSVLPSTLVDGLKVIGTFHPAAALRTYTYKAIMELDLRRAAEQMQSPNITYPSRWLHLPTSTWSRPGLVWENMNLDPRCADVAQEMLRADWLAVDIECYQEASGSWRLACVGFSDRPNRALVLDWRLPEHKALIRELCASPVAKVLQNGTFDQTVLHDNDVKLVNFAWDTMLAHHTLLIESASGDDEMSALGKRKRMNPLQKGLAFQTSIYTDEPFYKDDGKVWKATGDEMMFHRYNGLDCCVTREIRDVQEKQLTRRKLWDTFAHAMSLVQPLMRMTARGVRIDVATRKRLREKFEGEIIEMTNVLTAQAGGDVNVKSSKQVQELIYTKLGLPKQHNKKTGNVSADKFALTTLAQKHPHPVLLGMLRIRERRDFIERYLDAAVDSDGRMRCAFDITGTNTGRLSSRQSIYGSGTNLQNIPARRPDGRLIRRIFIADPGKVFLYADYSQAEARVVAHLARCKALIELFDDPTRDGHSENASRIFGIPLSTVGKDSLERFLAKQGVHAGNYGQGPGDMAARINAESEITGITVTVAECATIQSKVQAIYPEVRENYWRETEVELRRSRTLTSLFGRQRVFYDRWDDKLLRTAYAFKPQSTIGDLCCKALVRVFEEVELARPDLGAELLLNVHDALLLQCNRDKVEETAHEVQRCMEIPIPINGRDLLIPTDVKAGLNWDIYDKKNKENNPNGLRDLSMWLEAA